jgi:hypothetical protein
MTDLSALAARVEAGDLFAPLEAPELPAKPRKLDLRTEFLKARYGLPDEWVWHSFKALDDTGREFSMWSGGVYPFAKTRGKYKGDTDYKRPVPGTVRVVVLSEVEYKAWLPTWQVPRLQRNRAAVDRLAPYQRPQPC